jgi:hypothetical protein
MGRGAPGRRSGGAAGFAGATAALVTIGSSADGKHVPASFLGVSTEYWALPLFERHGKLLERVLSLLKVPGAGPLVLRIGGTSADVTFWDPSARPLPKWAFGVTREWFTRTAALLRRTGARVILDLNLLTDTPLVASRLASAGLTSLPRGSVLGFEIGNEPDLYSRAHWEAAVSGPRFDRPPFPNAISPGTYVHDFASYGTSLTRVAPGVPLLGPAAAYPGQDPNWISTLLRTPRRDLGIVSAHLYPYSACATPTSPSYPTIARLLSARATTAPARAIGPTVSLAHRAGVPVRVTELNSVTCGGRPGVSDTFATALWAPDALFELLHAGVDGVNVHVRESALNGAFALRNRGLIARPLLYGLMMFVRTLGPDAQLIPASVRAPGSANLKVWAVHVDGGRLHVLLINKSNRAATARVELPQNGPASVERLLAPTANSRSGVTLNGQWLGADGRWRGRGSHETITPTRGGYRVTVPALSAALLTVHLDGSTKVP